jgi:Spy/CpxP family protein refolding chaperone
MTPRVKGAVFLLLAFALGAGAGAAGFGYYHTRFGWVRPPEAGRFQQHVVDRLTRELDLRPDQRQQVETILKDTGQEFGRLREEMSPRFRELRTRGRERIQAVLDAGQRTKFESLAQEWERRADRWRDRSSGAAPGERKAP